MHNKKGSQIDISLLDVSQKLLTHLMINVLCCYFQSAFLILLYMIFHSMYAIRWDAICSWIKSYNIGYYDRFSSFRDVVSLSMV